MPGRLFVSEADLPGGRNLLETRRLSLVMYRTCPYMKIEAHMASDKYEKASVVKGHHVYKSIWTPVIGQELQFKPEDDNEHD